MKPKLLGRHLSLSARYAASISVETASPQPDNIIFGRNSISWKAAFIHPTTQAWLPMTAL